jgi:protein-tyrosine phosphatase
MNEGRIGVLFVCLGNICRSPVAEGVFRDVVASEGFEDHFDIDSAGTSDYHIGDSPDPRSAAEAQRRGLTLDHAARQIGPADFARFDYVIAMDASNLGRIKRLASGATGSAELYLLRSFDESARDDLEVPDPYFGGPDGFAVVHDMIERASRGLLEHIRAQHAL